MCVCVFVVSRLLRGRRVIAGKVVASNSEVADGADTGHLGINLAQFSRPGRSHLEIQLTGARRRLEQV